MESAGTRACGSVQAQAIGVATFGEDRVAAYETQPY